MALYTPEYKPTGKEVAIIKTSQGTIRVELDGEGAPIHVGNFVELAQKGFYDNLKFHRYVPGFVIQGGDPNTRDLDSEQVKAAEGNPFAGLARVVRATLSKRSSPRTRITSTSMARSPWLVRRIRIRWFAVLPLPWSATIPRFGLHGVRPDDRRHGRHRPAARRRRDRERRDRERRRIAIRDARRFREDTKEADEQRLIPASPGGVRAQGLPRRLAAYTQCLQDAGSSLAPGEVGLLYHQIGNCLVKLKNPNEAIHATRRRPPMRLRRVRRGELQPRHGLRLAA